jgi:hypothetical protein
MSAVLADDFMTGLKAGKTLRVLTSGQKKEVWPCDGHAGTV